jgi:UDP-3-O-acyl-N-acetylglucosamine deacetylase
VARSAEDQALRSELSEARFAILRQLELLRSPNAVRGGPPGNRLIIARLEQQLKEIEEALADLDG